MSVLVLKYLFYVFIIERVIGDGCHEEISKVISRDDSVLWSTTTTDEKIQQISNPLCLTSDRKLVTRKCIAGIWTPLKVACDDTQWGYVYDKSTLPGQGKCPEKSLQIDDNHCVIIEKHRKLHWREARRRCDLFNIISKKEQDIFIYLSKSHNLDSRDKCWMGLQRANNSFFWNNGEKVDFVNWSSSVKYDSNRLFGVVMHSGSWLILDDEAEMSCSICIRDINIENSLTFRKNHKNNLLLYIRHWPILWNLKCFVELINEEDKKEIKVEFLHEVFLSSKICNGVFQLIINEEDLGSYSCEASKPSGKIDVKDYWFQNPNTPPTLSVSFVIQDFQFKSFQERDFVIFTNSGKKLFPRKPRTVTWRELLQKNYTNSSLFLNGRHSIKYNSEINQIQLLSSKIHILEYQNISEIEEKSNDDLFTINKLTKISLDQKNFFLIYLMNVNDYLDMNIMDLKLIMFWLRPIEGCISGYDGLRWPYTKINQSATPREICLTSSGLPVTRKCIGSTIEEGAVWESVETNCNSPNISEEYFYQYLNCFSNEDISNLIEKINFLTVTQLFYLARKLECMQNVSLEMRLELLDQISLKTSAKSIMVAQQFNTTSLLAAAVDQLGNLEISEHQIIRFNQSITFLALAKHNITGIAILRNKEKENVIFISRDVNWDSPNLGFDSNLLEIAAWIPETALEGIPEETPIKITFLSKHIFPGSVAKQYVAAVSVEGYSELPDAIPIIVGSSYSNESRKCVYWDLNIGNWSTEGGELAKGSEEISVCLYNHLTHFAQLLLDASINKNSRNLNQMDSVHHLVLEWFTYTGCIFSLIGVSGILLTAIFFRSWREKPGTRILVHLSVTLGLQNGLFLISSIFTKEDLGENGCLALGASLHLVLLASFSWALVSAWLQYVRFIWVIQTSLPKYFTLKAWIGAWGVPLIFVISSICWDSQTYLSNDFCFVTGPPAFTFLLAPVSICVCLNATTYVLIGIAVFRGPDGNWRSDKNIIYAQIRLGILLFFLLGLSWTFGLLTRLGGGLVFMYLFCATATIQGFVLLIFYIILNPETRKLWIKFLKKYFLFI